VIWVWGAAAAFSLGSFSSAELLAASNVRITMKKGLEQLQNSPGDAADWGQSLFEEMQAALPGADPEFIFAWLIELNRLKAEALAEIERLRSQRSE
jgi:hypothetical protein